MSWQASAWAMDVAKDFDLEPITRYVLLMLANYADKEGNDIYPSLSTLEADTGLSERTIRRHIKTLIDVRLLDYGDQDAVKNNKRIRPDQRPKVYRLLFDRDEATGSIDFHAVGKMPSAKHRPSKAKNNDRSQSPPVETPAQPVDNSQNEPEKTEHDRTLTTERPDTRGVTESNKPLTLKDKPASTPARHVPSVDELEAGRALRQQARERLVQRGVFKAEIFDQTFKASIGGKR